MDSNISEILASTLSLNKDSGTGMWLVSDSDLIDLAGRKQFIFGASDVGELTKCNVCQIELGNNKAIILSGDRYTKELSSTYIGYLSNLFRQFLGDIPIIVVGKDLIVSVIDQTDATALVLNGDGVALRRIDSGK